MRQQPGSVLSPFFSSFCSVLFLGGGGGAWLWPLLCFTPALTNCCWLAAGLLACLSFLFSFPSLFLLLLSINQSIQPFHALLLLLASSPLSSSSFQVGGQFAPPASMIREKRRQKHTVCCCCCCCCCCCPRPPRRLALHPSTTLPPPPRPPSSLAIYTYIRREKIQAATTTSLKNGRTDGPGKTNGGKRQGREKKSPPPLNSLALPIGDKSSPPTNSTAPPYTPLAHPTPLQWFTPGPRSPPAARSAAAWKNPAPATSSSSSFPPCPCPWRPGAPPGRAPRCP